MAGTKEIKRRIKSVKNTKKITKAMELVAASKMKRAVSSALASRAYASYALELLNSLSGSTGGDIKHPFFTDNSTRQDLVENSKTLIVLITSNRGLCGAYNSQVIKKTLATMKGSQIGVGHLSKVSNTYEFITIGKKGDVAMRRIGQNIIATFTELPNNITLRDILPISKMIADEYKKGEYSKVLVAYTDFVSALSQVPNMRKLLPISAEALRKDAEKIGENSEEKKMVAEIKNSYTFEGDPEKLLNMLAEKLIRMQVYQMIIESNASEQSSRMVAMKNASEAAGEMIDDLTLVFNKARQAGITQEISEISGGMAASVS